MNTDPAETFAEADAAPSAAFVQAISHFFDTDPQDLLVELGYYQRDSADGGAETAPGGSASSQ